ncbi:hypothetical protein SAMN05518861_108210 [Mesorhizobium sp. YR577]|jgi:hypothetical protein|nr:hypothetical protein SAMN05518861_108210 [Mesorhizobium sp. YR577]
MPAPRPGGSYRILEEMTNETHPYAPSEKSPFGRGLEPPKAAFLHPEYLET